jgi:hypothetical protein
MRLWLLSGGSAAGGDEPEGMRAGLGYAWVSLFSGTGVPDPSREIIRPNHGMA